MKLNIVFAIGILLVIGYFGARFARKIKLPEVTGYIIAGILIGPGCLHLIPASILEEGLSPIIDIALGVIAFLIGANLNIRKIRQVGKSILWITSLQAVGTFLIVTFAILAFSPFISKLLNTQASILPFALVLGAIASATAPAATVAVVKELKAKGSLTTTLLAVVALDDALAIVIFGICNAIATTGHLVITPFIEVVGALALGIIAGFILRLLSKYLKTAAGFLIMSLGMVCLVSGISIKFNLSLLLSNMAVGFIIANGLRRDLRYVLSLDNITPPLYATFFVLAGTFLRFTTLAKVGLLGLAFIVARVVGKTSGAALGGTISRAPQSIRKYLGIALLPQAGVAVGLVLAAEANPGFAAFGDIMINIVLASVAINEIIGPPLTAFALRQAGEARVEK